MFTRLRLSNPVLWGICICLAVALASVIISPPCRDCHYQTPQVNTHSQAEKRIEPQNDASNPGSGINQGSNPKTGNGAEEASEYWTVLGRHLKITDTLLVIFTFTLWLATRDLVLSAEETSERQLRAYISHQDNCSVEWKQVGEHRRFLAHTIVKNYGQTPAYRCRTTQQIDIFESADPVLPHGELEGDTIIGPSSNRHGSIPLMISNDDYTLVQNGQKFIFVWGKIEYVDAFGKDRFFEFYDCIAFVNGRWEYRPSYKPQRGN